MTPAEPASLLECDARGEDDSPDETRLSLETAAPSAGAGEGDSDAAPYVGQRFPTHDAAYEFYSGFARRCGFSIRRHRTEGKDGVGRGLTRRYFVCHRAGSAPAKPLAGAPRPQRNKSSSRCGCQAYMRIGKGADDAGGPLPEWRVMGFSNHHNHALLGQDKVRLLPAYRFISGADRDRILMLAESGITVQQMMRIMELEKCIEPGNLPFTEKDVRNLIQSRKVEHEEDESVDLLRMCKNFKEKDPNFKCEFTKDANNHVENIAWTYADSVQSYELFGDAVVFDTTHRLSALDMVLGIWVGLNNYGRPFFFACVLLREENQISFGWALQVFLNFMNRKAPLTILTDQNICLKEAIKKELPSTKHVLCKWLIAARFPSWFGANLGERYKDWKIEFDRLYNMDSTVAFDLGWNDMVNCYGLHGNEHIASLFASRNLWALPYLRGYFTAGLITSPAVSKSTNAFIQRFLSAQTHLANFIEQVYPCPKGSLRHRDVVKKIGGKEQFPLLIDASTGISMYESGDIVKYLFRQYGQGKSPSPGLLESTIFTGWVPTLLRAGRGMTLWNKAGAVPAEKLELFSYENNSYARIVREALCELELPYVLQNVGEGSSKTDLLLRKSGSKQVPYLIDPNTGFQSNDHKKILAYLFQQYSLSSQ